MKVLQQLAKGQKGALSRQKESELNSSNNTRNFNEAGSVGKCRQYRHTQASIVTKPSKDDWPALDPGRKALPVYDTVWNFCHEIARTSEQFSFLCRGFKWYNSHVREWVQSFVLLDRTCIDTVTTLPMCGMIRLSMWFIKYRPLCQRLNVMDPLHQDWSTLGCAPLTVFKLSFPQFTRFK